MSDPKPRYYSDVGGKCLRVLVAVATNGARQQTLKGIGETISRLYPDFQLNEGQIRSYLVTLEAEGLLVSMPFEGTTLYGPGPLLAQLTFRFFQYQRQQVEELMLHTQQALGQIPIPTEAP